MTRADEATSMPIAAAGNRAAGPRSSRSRRPLAVEYRVATGASGDELRRRELELERLIIKAACHRAARLADTCGPGGALAGDDPSSGIAAADQRAVLGAR